MNDFRRLMRKMRSESKSTALSKRPDLQGIRGLAIISVLGFHFFPNRFPNGFLGVDQFFVLSGFLMQMLLSKSFAKDPTPCSLILTFYSRRFRRILPLYLVFLLVSLLSLYNFFPSSSVETNLESASRALIFVSNRPKSGAEDYFQMLSIAIDIFTHTWSLSVEVQFYLIVPLVFLLASRVTKCYQNVLYIIIASLSFIFHVISPSTVAFNSVFARIWQFSAGMIVLLISSTFEDPNRYNPLKTDGDFGFCDSERFLEEEMEKDGESGRSKVKNKVVINICKTFLLLSVISVINFPIVIDPQFSRPFITIATSLIILINDSDKLLSNRMLIYIGDISYSLYLIHWPIYAYWKLTAEGNEIELYISLIASLITAIIVYETYEKWYLQLSSTSIRALVALLFFINVLIIDKDHIQLTYHQLISGNDHRPLDPVTDNMTLNDAARLNYQWNVNDNRNLISSFCDYETPETKPIGWCKHKGLSPLGTYKLAIFGNSWTANHATLFHEECGDKARSILQGSAYACEPLFPTRDKVGCEEMFVEFEQRIRAEQPDYGFILTRYISIGEPLKVNVPDDFTYQRMLNKTRILISSITIKLFILDALPRLNTDKVDKIVPMLKNKVPPGIIDGLLIDMEGFQNAKRRYAQLIKDCGDKCELIDYAPSFFNNSTNTFRFFDNRGFSYFTSTQHLSFHGLEHVRGVWKGVCDGI